MNPVLTLDRIAIGAQARITAIDPAGLAEEEVRRLGVLGFEVGTVVRVAHRGVFAGRDPLAVAVGRSIVALRRIHARALRVALIEDALPAPHALAPPCPGLPLAATNPACSQ